MENKNYIPSNIYDVAAVERLKCLPFEYIKKDIPVLLEWLQDTHWDVAEGIAEYLIPHINEITEELLFILNSDDGMWKYFVINILIAHSKSKLSPLLIEKLIKIAKHPSKNEIEDTVDEAAQRIINNRILIG
jgi:hypothetical protein